MNDAAKHISTANGTVPETATVSSRDLLSDTLMRSRLVEIADVLLEHPMQMPLTQGPLMIETLLTH